MTTPPGEVVPAAGRVTDEPRVALADPRCAIDQQRQIQHTLLRRDRQRGAGMDLVIELGALGERCRQELGHGGFPQKQIAAILSATGADAP